MAIREALLALTQAEPKFGLQLKTEFETYTGEVWPLNVGQVYSTLARLERDGDVEAAGGTNAEAGQKLYTITTQGTDSLQGWLNSTKSSKPPRNELVIKILIAITMDSLDLQQLIQKHRRPLVESMQNVTRLKSGDASMATLMAADAELYRLEAAVRWLDTVETRLRHGGQILPPTAAVQPTDLAVNKAQPTAQSERSSS